jgi:predicted nucleic-acid-binding protein
VQAELAWVLSRAFGLKKLNILHIPNGLYESLTFSLQKEYEFSDALETLKKQNIDFSDSLIPVESLGNKSHFYTFDKKLSTLKHVSLLA